MTYWPEPVLTLVYYWMSVLCLSVLSSSAFASGWIIRSVCLPSQVTVSAVSGWHIAWSFPMVCQLLFSASGDKHQSTHKGKKCSFAYTSVSSYSHSVISRKTCPGDGNLHCEIKWSYYFIHIQNLLCVSAVNQNHLTDLFLIIWWKACLFIWHL